MRHTPGSKTVPVNVVGSCMFGRYAKISSEKTYNMFESDGWMINTAGYKRIYELLPSLGTNGRGFHNCVRGGIIVAVTGSSVFKIDQNFVVLKVGELSTETGEVFIEENLNSQVCIVDGTNIYIYNYSIAGPNLAIQSGLGNLVPKYVDYHNTFFLFGNGDVTSNGAAWYAYQYDTPTTIVQATPGQFALQTKPDFASAVVRLPGQGNNVLVMGSSVCEIWTQVGGLQNYRRNPTINIDYGVASVSTIARSDTYVTWLGINENNAPVIMVYTGQSVGPISSDGIDYVMSEIQFPAQSTGMFFRQDGHLFYQLTFYNEADNVTFLYDFTTKKFYNLSDYAINFHPAREYVYFHNKLYFISLNNSSIYESSTNYTTYDENIGTQDQDPTINYEIPRLRICGTYQEEDSSQFRPNTFSFIIEQGCDPNVSAITIANSRIYIITESAFVQPEAIIYTEYDVPIVDELSGSGSDQDSTNTIPYQPRVDMSVSRDGGITWGNTVARNLNPIGYRQNILNWDNLGACNSMTIKLRFWGTSRFVANNGFMEIY